MDKKSTRKISQAERKADSDIDLSEKLWEALPKLVRQSDKAIAAEVDSRFDIPAEAVLRQFAREDEADFSTYELIMMAHDPSFWS